MSEPLRITIEEKHILGLPELGQFGIGDTVIIQKEELPAVTTLDDGPGGTDPTKPHGKYP